MPMLADLDDPPRSRLGGFVLGALVGLPLVALLAWLVLPNFVGAIQESADDFDRRLREEEQYMKRVCDEAFDEKRDEKLCGCVWAVEFPGFDCRGPYNRWSLERQQPRCADEVVRNSARSFCSCVDAIADKVAKATEAGDEDALRQAIQNYDNCVALEGAMALPAVESLGGGS
ncbi:MAG: hypothetical protein R3B09_04070 [Nannocystaceae bacterium]